MLQQNLPLCLILLPIFLLITSCTKQNPTPTSIAPENMPLIVAHRGASHDAPENTLPAFNLAWEQNADQIEGDFYLTADQKIVCHHDKTTKKTAGHDQPVESQSLAELQRHDVGKWKHSKFANTKIPTLKEVLAIVPPNKTILIEIKSDSKIIPALLKELESTNLNPSQITIICFNEEVIAAVKNARPDLKALWLTSFDQNQLTGSYTPTLDTIIKTAKRIQADGVDLKANLSILNKNFVSQLRAANLEFHAWTVDDPQTARNLINLGVISITTNRPAYLRKQLTNP